MGGGRRATSTGPPAEEGTLPFRNGERRRTPAVPINPERPRPDSSLSGSPPVAPMDPMKPDSAAGSAEAAQRAAAAERIRVPALEELLQEMERARMNTISLKRVDSEPEVAPLKMPDRGLFSPQHTAAAASGGAAANEARSDSAPSAPTLDAVGHPPDDNRAVKAPILPDTTAGTAANDSTAVLAPNGPPMPDFIAAQHVSGVSRCPRPYKVALFAWESLYSVAVGGVAPHVTELAAGLERRGHEVHLFVRSGMGQPTYERIDGVHVHRCGFDGSPDFVVECENMCNSFMHALYEVECFMNSRFDIIHCHDWLTGAALTNAKYRMGRRACIFTVHSTEYGRSGNQHYGGQSARIRDIEQAAISAADRVICVSGVLCDEVKAVYAFDWNKLRCVHNGINALRYDGSLWDPAEVRARYQVGPLDPMVLFVGRMAVQKGPDLLVEAAPFILKARSDVKFVMVGDGYLKSSLEARCREVGASDAFRWTGTMGGAPLVELFQACDVVCVPSRNEPFGIVVLEAWASKKPVVVTKNGGPREFVAHDGEGYQIDTEPGSIAWGICKCFENFEHTRFLGEQGRRKAREQFSWDRIAELTNNVYDELMLV
ncbi:hypothetical protein CDCA_CDCA14G3874 [Cyanidium caldarium]|uniref:Uncharacterized protein n=1 Tax=Cyanidium caldarium TaxID=2771 RepID=A0AAV9IZX2_CYACA|nr:hypothetical protein CDCA_CDCA14G3874 [Cyanidium caldarium]